MEDDVRALEREVATHGEPAARLRLARALERAGRKDDAFDVLAPAAWDDARIRGELDRFPRWTHITWGSGTVGGPAGQTGWLDVAPLRRPARVRWRHTLFSNQRLDERWPWIRVVASAAGVLVNAQSNAGEESPGLLALEPDSGEVRWQQEDFGGAEVIALNHGIGLRSVRDKISSHDLIDLRCGALLRGLRHDVWLADHDLLVINEDDETSALLVTPNLGLSRAWRAGGAVGRGWLGTVSYVLDSDYDARDRATGEKLWRTEDARHPRSGSGFLYAVMADAAGVGFEWTDTTTTPSASGTSTVDATGRPGLALPDHGVLAMTPTSLILSGGRGAQLAAVDRTSGERRSLCKVPRSKFTRRTPVAGARSVIYVGEDAAVQAVTLDGQLLWRFALPEGETLEMLAVYPRRLYVATTRSILCLEEGGAPG